MVLWSRAAWCYGAMLHGVMELSAHPLQMFASLLVSVRARGSREEKGRRGQEGRRQAEGESARNLLSPRGLHNHQTVRALY